MKPAANPEGGHAGPADTPVAIYTRVSDNKQLGRRFESCESQAAICRDYIQNRAKEGWHEVAYFTDPAYTGANMRRPAMDALKRLVEAGGAKKVVIFKLERVLRSTDEWTPFRAFLQQHGCELASAMEDISEKTALGRLKNNILVSVSEYDRLNIGEKVRAKMREQAKRGLWNGGSIPYGYAYDKNTQTLRPDPIEAPVVRRLFKHAAELGSLTELANTLNAEGLRTKIRILHRRDGAEETVGNRLFRSDGIRLMIANPLYRGAVRYGGNEYPGQHEALVTPELWERANAATRETQVRPVDLIAERDRHLHLLKGIAWCGHCQRTLVPHASGLSNNAGKRYRYYNCGFVLRERQPRACPVGRLAADALEGAVLGFLGQISRHPALVTGVLEATRRRTKADRGALRTEMESTEKNLAQITKELAHCVDAVAKGGLELLGDDLRKRAQTLRLEQQRLMVERERKRQELAACDAAALDEQRIRHSLERIATLLPQLAPDEQKELVRLFVQRVEVGTPPKAGHSPPATDDSSARRILAVRIKLHLPGLVEGIEGRETLASQIARVARPVAVRGVNFETQVDFTHAVQGEVTIVTPFQHAMRLPTRSGTVRPPVPVEPTPQHPIIRAQRWQQMLNEGQIANRVALAKRFGITPGAVTRILKLTEVLPEIQRYLATLKTKEEVRHFGMVAVGKFANQPAAVQRAEFSKMRQDFRVRLG